MEVISDVITEGSAEKFLEEFSEESSGKILDIQNNFLDRSLEGYLEKPWSVPVAIFSLKVKLIHGGNS